MVHAVIESISRDVPTLLTELHRLGRTLKQRAADILAFFNRPGSLNGPTEAINGQLEHLRGTALSFRNLRHYIACSLLEAGGFPPQLHPKLRSAILLSYSPDIPGCFVPGLAFVLFPPGGEYHPQDVRKAPQRKAEGKQITSPNSQSELWQNAARTVLSYCQRRAFGATWFVGSADILIIGLRVVEPRMELCSWHDPEYVSFRR